MRSVPEHYPQKHPNFEYALVDDVVWQSKFLGLARDRVCLIQESNTMHQ